MNFLIFILVIVCTYKLYSIFMREGFEGNCYKNADLFEDSGLNHEYINGVYNSKISEEGVSFGDAVNIWPELDILKKKDFEKPLVYNRCHVHNDIYDSNERKNECNNDKNCSFVNFDDYQDISNIYSAGRSHCISSNEICGIYHNMKDWNIKRQMCIQDSNCEYNDDDDEHPTCSTINPINIINTEIDSTNCTLNYLY